ncbi:MAG: DUF1501 domain-containing protein [Lentisphaerae bacterium]|nr:DUF1501 domain-containing protein [Lentisphaerota bacterium]
MTTRREFMKTLAIGGGGGLLMPSLFSSALAAAAKGVGGGVADAPILIVLQLSGGNDGLNMVVPMGNDDYARARPKLAIGRKSALSLTADTGLHPALAGVKGLYDDGQVAVVHAVGYPNPNRSHFRAMEIWQTAADADRYEDYGWIGRYFDRYCRAMDGSVGVAIGGPSPQAFQAASPKGLSFKEPSQLQVRGARAGRGGLDGDAWHEAYEDMNGLDGEDMSGATIGALTGKPAIVAGQSPLAFLEQTARDAQAGALRMERIQRTGRNLVAFPTTGLGRDCSLVARLIAGEMPTRVYYLSLGGFDTHTNQAGTQERLLREVGDALAALLADLKAQGNRERVQIVMFSEFGRRVKENANGGTDHGAAGPVLIFGGGVRGGVVGAYPSLAAADLERGDVSFRVDFRSIYATLLERHLGVASAPVLGRQYPLCAEWARPV